LIERRKTLVDEDRTTTYITPNLLSPKKKGKGRGTSKPCILQQEG
jgi:hypothetical protein